MNTAFTSSDRCLLAVLWVGILLIGLPIVQHVFLAAETQVPDQPPPLMTGDIPAMPLLSEMNMQAKSADSLFKPAKQPLPEAPAPHAQADKSDRTANVVPHLPPWQLQILRPPVAEALVLTEIADGYRHLRSGHLPLARQAFQIVLTHDTHSVEAMEGMLLLARRSGDGQSEADYLERLRLEIPFYEHDPVSHAYSDQGQG
ncbi:hypothetical protein [Methylophilus sp.]|uniref:hypothetical protein n=1 Tax=Methylophilus sp. TaxID=29541 RepID=UPI0040367D01